MLLHISAAPTTVVGYSHSADCSWPLQPPESQALLPSEACTQQLLREQGWGTWMVLAREVGTGPGGRYLQPVTIRTLNL